MFTVQCCLKINNYLTKLTCQSISLSGTTDLSLNCGGGRGDHIPPSHSSPVSASFICNVGMKTLDSTVFYYVLCVKQAEENKHLHSKASRINSFINNTVETLSHADTRGFTQSLSSFSAASLLLLLVAVGTSSAWFWSIGTSLPTKVAIDLREGESAAAS